MGLLTTSEEEISAVFQNTGTMMDDEHEPERHKTEKKRRKERVDLAATA